MNLALVDPIIKYVFFTWLPFLFLSEIFSLKIFKDFKFKENVIIFGFIVTIIGYGILSSFIIIFLSSAGLIFNYDLLFNSFIILYFIYVGRLSVKEMGFKITSSLVILPFIISYIVFYTLFYGDKIYRLSPQCNNTKDYKIKICKLSNGTYIGEMKAFKRHGLGKYTWNSGKTYSGEWKNGKKLK